MWTQPYNTYEVLQALANSDQDGMTVNELANLLDMSIQQVCRAVNRLYSYHWLYRRRIPCNYHSKGWVYGYSINQLGQDYLDYKEAESTI